MRNYPWLDGNTPFPPVETADRQGILALGGDLSVSRLLDAYTHGIFPWFDDDQPIIWWSPNPRFVLFPEKVLVSRSMKKILARGEFTITYDRCFREVMSACSEAPRRGQRGTWITAEMLEAYCNLHAEGYAHSVEAWKNDSLVGGMYGICLGRAFFGESMFSRESNASKAAFLTLAEKLKALDFAIIDSQVHTNHIESLGGEHIPRKEYLAIINEALKQPTLKGKDFSKAMKSSL
jgi:leucyl/phenylalanyl-tRNA---protein transferase